MRSSTLITGSWSWSRSLLLEALEALEAEDDPRRRCVGAPACVSWLWFDATGRWRNSDMVGVCLLVMDEVKTSCLGGSCTGPLCLGRFYATFMDLLISGSFNNCS